MWADQAGTDAKAFGFLLRLTGGVSLARVGGLMAVASATEGIGLLLLVPIVQIVTGGGHAGAFGSWAAQISAVPLGVLLGAFVLLVTVRAAIVYRVRMARAELGNMLTRKLRATIQRAVVGARWRWLSEQRSADHGALIVGESSRIGGLVTQALDLVTVLITMAVLLSAAMWLSWKLTFLALTLALVLALLRLASKDQREALGEDYSNAYTRLQRLVGEGLLHLRAARIAGAEASLNSEFDAATGALETADMRYATALNRASALVQVASALVLAIVVEVGLGPLSVPLAVFVPVLAIFLRFVPLVGVAQEGWRAWRYCQPAIENLMRTADQARAAAEPVVGEDRPLAFENAIDIDRIGVRFAGRQTPVFDGFSLRIPAGTVLAVSGPSGSGKSTFADLLAGLVTPDSGQIRVDGVPLVGEDQIHWRRQVAYVEQNPYLLDDTIGANVAWGFENVSADRLSAALRAASAHFVFDLPRGIETLVGEDGRELSGGERQRISLARALLRKPSLVILDEVTAALDAVNEAAVARTIEALRGTCTFVILGHRPSLHSLADIKVDLGDA